MMNNAHIDTINSQDKQLPKKSLAVVRRMKYFAQIDRVVFVTVEKVYK